MVARLYFVDGIENDKSSLEPIDIHATISNKTISNKLLFVPTIMTVSVAKKRTTMSILLASVAI